MPASVQAELVSKLAPYDRSFAERAGKKVLIVLVTKDADIDSSRAALQMRGAFQEIGVIAGLPHEELIVHWTGAHELVELCAKLRVAIVYLTPGLAAEIAPLAKELDGRSVLTVASVLPYVVKGAVLGFELVSGRPKLVINLTQAKKQSVQFRAEVLKLMRVIE